METELQTSVGRAIAVLDSFRTGDRSLSLAELAGRTGFYKSTILRLAQSLQRANFLVRLEDGRYQLGAALIRLGEISKSSSRIDDHILPVLQKLAAETGESATLYVRKGSQRFCLRRVDSRRTLRDHIREGDLLPLTIGAPGRVFLYFDSDVARPNLARGEVPTEFRTNPSRPLPIITRGEYEPELATVACGVFGPGDELLGVISLTGLSSRYHRKAVQAMSDMLLESCEQLTERLGGGLHHYAPRKPPPKRSSGRPVIRSGSRPSR
jgi:DNA-binding IclR family transcriptional regulator